MRGAGDRVLGGVEGAARALGAVQVEGVHALLDAAADGGAAHVAVGAPVARWGRPFLVNQPLLSVDAEAVMVCHRILALTC